MSTKIYKYVLDFDIKFRRDVEWHVKRGVTFMPDLAIIFNLIDNLKEFELYSFCSLYPYVPLLVRISSTRFESVAKELTEMLVSALWRWVETNDIKYLYESFKYFSPINAVLIYAGLNKPSQLVDWLVKQDYEFKGKSNNIYIYVKEIPNGLIMFQIEKTEGKPLSEEAISFIATLSGVLTHVHHVLSLIHI